MKSVHVISALLALIVCGCGRHQKQLERIDHICESNPSQAVFALDSIDYVSLNEKERHYYDLLYVKTRDKASARHVSDSLILDAIDYYSRRKDRTLYPQSIYYGGRVYADLGDFPTAMEYFRKAADILADEIENNDLIKLRTEALSMTGRLLAELKRSQEAIPYIRKSIYDLKQLKDSAGVVYDNLQLVKVFAEESYFDSAKYHLSEAVRYSDPIRDEGKAWIQSERASIMMYEGKEDSAMLIMKPLTRLVDSLYNTSAYHPTGKFFKDGTDAGYIYAKEFSFSRDFNNRVVVTQHMHPLIPKDSARSFVMEYESLYDDNLSRYESPKEMLQKTKFNYDIHLKARRKAEAEKKRIIWAGGLLLIAAVVLALYFRIRSLKNELRLRTALNIIDRIEFAAQLEDTGLNEPISPARIDYVRRIKSLPMTAPAKPSLKDELLSGLMSVSGDGMPKPKVDESLKTSIMLETLQRMLADGKGIAQNNEDLWLDIEKAVEGASPGFRTKLDILASGKLTKSEYQVALLAKFGITPKNISALLYKSKSAITDRRSSLAKKIFGPKADTSALDRLILRL